MTNTNMAGASCVANHFNINAVCMAIAVSQLSYYFGWPFTVLTIFHFKVLPHNYVIG